MPRRWRTRSQGSGAREDGDFGTSNRRGDAHGRTGSLPRRKGRTDCHDAPESTWKGGCNVVSFGVEGEVLVLFNVVNEETMDPNLVRRQCG